MIWLYRLGFLPALLLASPWFLWRMWRRGGYARGFWHRLGGTPPLPAKATGRRRVWVQAVSVGEVLAVGPLLRALQVAGDLEIYLTTTTSTGYQVAGEKYAGLTVGLGYFPLDFWPCSARAWRRIQPDLCLLLEGERWPEHLHAAHGRGVPVVAVNARLSDRSFRRSLRGRGIVRALSAGFSLILCASSGDERRFRALGFGPGRLRTTGNLKLDVEIPPLAAADRARLRRELGVPDTGLVLLGSSTWPGEEAALLAAWRQARAQGVAVTLVLVPRHAERRAELQVWLAGEGVSHHFRTAGAAPGPVEVAVADTTGELRQITQLADLVFVGKSLAPHEGGQTPVEAAVLGKPVLHGPHMTNFREIVQTLTEAGAVRRVETTAALGQAVGELLADAPLREKLAAAATAWSAVNRGATARTVAAIREVLAAR